jgi:two-component system response regulator FixJ
MSVEPTVFVVDDEPDVREALSLVFESVGLRVTAFDSATAFLEQLDPSRPGCLVSDVRMPGMSGLDLQQELIRRGVRLPMLIISAHGDVPTAVRAMEAGAVYFLEKPFSDQMLLDKVQRAIADDAARRTVERQREDLRQRYQSLTPREREVMQHVVAGKLNKVVAADLEVSTRTIELHRARVMEKMQAKSLAELVRYAELIGEPGEGA